MKRAMVSSRVRILCRERERYSLSVRVQCLRESRHGRRALCRTSGATCGGDDGAQGPLVRRDADPSERSRRPGALRGQAAPPCQGGVWQKIGRQQHCGAYASIVCCADHAYRAANRRARERRQSLQREAAPAWLDEAHQNCMAPLCRTQEVCIPLKPSAQLTPCRIASTSSQSRTCANDKKRNTLRREHRVSSRQLPCAAISPAACQWQTLRRNNVTMLQARKQKTQPACVPTSRNYLLHASRLPIIFHARPTSFDQAASRRSHLTAAASTRPRTHTTASAPNQLNRPGAETA